MMMAIVTCVPCDTSLWVFFFFKVHLCIIYIRLPWAFVAVWALSSRGERGLLFVAVPGLLLVVACLTIEHGL